MLYVNSNKGEFHFRLKKTMTEKGKSSGEVFDDPDNRSSGGTFESEKNHNDGNNTNNNHEQTRDKECEKAEHKSEVCGLPTVEIPKSNKMLACLVCRRRCDSTLSLKKHVYRHICNVPVYQCKECKGHFADKIELLMHSDEKYDDNKGYLYKNSYVCSLCGRRFSKKSACRDHIVQHKNMTYECKKCGWMFDTSYRVHVHRSLWHLREGDEEIPKTSVVKTDQDVKEGRSLGYKCWMKNCTEFFAGFDTLTEHMKQKHRATHQTCKLCTRFINSRTEFDQHVRQHESLKYKCREEYCGASYGNFKMLRSHYFSRHKFGISEADQHRYHVDKMETSADQYVSTRQVSPDEVSELSVSEVSENICNICNRVLHTKDQFQHHVQNHERMTYVCKVDGCGWAFELYQSLGGHVSNMHTWKGGNASSPARGENSSQSKLPGCHLCGRNFKTLPDYEYHIQHHDALKYVCREAGCIRRYDKFTGLQAHCNKDHRVSISIKDEVFYIREYLSDDAGFGNNCTAITETTAPILEASPSHALGREIFICKEPGCEYVRERFATLQAHYYSNHKTKISIKDKDSYLLGATAIKVEDSSTDAKNSEMTTTENNLLYGPAIQNSLNGGPTEPLESIVSPPETLNGKMEPLEACRPFTCTGRKCSVCNRYFINDAELEYHQNNHYRMQHTCRFANCGFMYEEHDQLQCHYRVRHTKQTGKSGGQMSEQSATHLCNLCGRRFRSEQFLEHHLKHHDKMKYMCQEGCKHLFEDFMTLYQHYHRVHNQKVSKVNEHLFLTDDLSAGLLPGQKIHVQMKNVCSLCSRRFQYQQTLQHHIERHDEMRYMCKDGCGAMYEVFKELYVHYQNVHKKRISKLELPQYLIDGKEVPETEGLDPNVKKSIRCEFCRRPFKSVANYENHIQNHDRMKYMCDRGCGYLYIHFHLLKSHYYKVHKRGITGTDEARFLIENVKISTPGKDAPGISKASTRQDRTCKICNRYFSRVEQLTYHVENHEKMKYRCNQGCGFMYEKFELMRFHYNHHHKMFISMKDKHTYLIPGALVEANTSQETVNTDDSQRTVSYENSVLDQSAEFSDRKPSRSERTCNLCKRYFMNVASLENHLKNHDNMKYRCIHNCSFLYEDFTPLKYHCRDTHKIIINTQDIPTYTIPPESATGDGPTSCSLCKREFHKPKKCVRHMKKHHKMTFRCEYCKWLYEEFKSLQLHYKRRHKEDKPPTDETKYRIENDGQNLRTTVKLSVKSCTLCARKFHIEEKCAEHMKNHAKMVFKCRECGWRYEDFEALRRHYQRRHDLSIAETDEHQYKTDPSEIQAEFDQKEIDHDEKTDCHVPCKCVHCNRRFHNEKLLSHHLEIHHLMVYSCDLCGWQYEAFDIFQMHYSRKHDITLFRPDEHKFRIAMKDVKLSKKKDKMHSNKKKNRKDEPKLKCPTCGREFQGEQEEYKYHIDNHDSLWCKCAVCGWTFEQVDALQRHSFTHCTSKSCQNPDKKQKVDGITDQTNGIGIESTTSMNTNGNPETEESAKSTVQAKLPRNEVSFECPNCGRTFRSEFRLNSHIENHERMTYVCKVCGWRFETFNTLQVHHAVHHKSSRINSAEEQIYTLKPSENSSRPDRNPRQGEPDYEKIIPKTEKQEGKIRGKVDTATGALSGASPSSLKLTEAECLEQIGHVRSKFQCLICGRTFKVKAKAIVHIQNHQHVMYTCESCGWMFESQAALKVHNYHRHNENKKEEKQAKSIDTDHIRSATPVQVTIKKEPEEDMCTRYKCFRCRMLFDEFRTLQEHYLSQHDTMISSDDESMCMVKAPAPAQPQTSKPANIFESLTNSSTIDDQGSTDCSLSNEKKRKRMSEEEVVEKMKKRRRTTTEELSDAESGETVTHESPSKTKLSAPVVKLFSVDRTIGSPGKRSPARSEDNTRKSPDTLSSLLNGTD